MMLALLRTRMSCPDAAFSARISVSRSDATLVFCHSARRMVREKTTFSTVSSQIARSRLRGVLAGSFATGGQYPKKPS